MLVLTRNIGETLIIGDDIALTVTGTNGMAVKFGIDAPEHVKVLREELLEGGKAGAPARRRTPYGKRYSGRSNASTDRVFGRD